MAEVWFEKIASMEKDGADIAAFQEDLKGVTLVGEYVGHQEHQHLVKYSRVSLIFYAVVDNYSSESCIPCDQAWSLFSKWGLDRVQIKSIGTYTSYDKMCDDLCTTFKDVAKSEIAEDEEGNVLYFVEKDE